MRTTAHLPGSAGYLSALRYHALTDCRQFLDAQRFFLAPTENMICGDTAGNIAWQASAASPRRPNWHGRLPVPGTGAYEWDGLRDDLPRELNPARGWIATANHDIHPDGLRPAALLQGGRSRARRPHHAAAAAVEAPPAQLDDRGPHAAAARRALAAGARISRLFRGWTSPTRRSSGCARRSRRGTACTARDSHAAALVPEVARDSCGPPRNRERPRSGRGRGAAARRTDRDEGGRRDSGSRQMAAGEPDPDSSWGQQHTRAFRHPLLREVRSADRRAERRRRHGRRRRRLLSRDLRRRELGPLAGDQRPRPVRASLVARTTAAW